MIIYRGRSLLDGADIVALAIPVSSNEKTGNMVQTYILRADALPQASIDAGTDSSICGDCTHRGDASQGIGRTCYVNIGQGPTVVYKKFARGGYPDAQTRAQRRAIGAGRMVRLGTYGDPAAVPARVWRDLVAIAIGHTGYTHQWRRARFAWLKNLCMASADTVRDRDDARAAGWRTFRVIMPGDAPKARETEATCPASKEAGKVLTCVQCLACSGTSSTRAGSIVINAHGGFAVMANVNKRVSV